MKDTATQRTRGRADQLRQSILDLQHRLDAVIGVVKPCADLVDRINQLADLRDRKQNQLNDLRVSQPNEPADDDERTVWTARRKELAEEIEGCHKQIVELHGPFSLAETQVRSFIAELRSVLDFLPMDPPRLREIRAEMEKLSIWKDARSLPRLSMRGAYAGLEVVKVRLDELVECWPRRSGLPTLRCFPTPVGAGWSNVSIRFTGDLAVQITVQGVTEPRNYVEMGFEDRRKRTAAAYAPNSAWSLLRELAKQSGSIRDPQQARSKNWVTVETSVSAVNKKLRALFGIAGNPIQYHRREKCYRAELGLAFPDADRL